MPANGNSNAAPDRASTGTPSGGSGAPLRRPNVLLVSVDDMNDWVGCLGGYPGVSTPNLDALANRGVLFRNAHCPSPLCNPARTAILTGRRPSSTGVYDNMHWWRPNLPGIVTLPMQFRAHGYTAAGAGKVFHHTDGFNPPDQWDEYSPLKFDDPWDREKYMSVEHEPRPAWHPMNGMEPYYHEHDWGVLEKPEADWGDAKAVDWAARFLARQHDRPFFLAVGTFHPHIPWYAPRRFFDRYPKRSVRLPKVFDSDLESLPPAGLKFAEKSRDRFEQMIAAGEWENAVQAYLACISFTDELVGRLVQALDSSAYARNTVVVFYSDNGYHLGEKKHFTKCTLWERSTHVPFIVVPRADDPRPWKPFATGAPASTQDIYPTLLELCGLPLPETGLDGESIAPHLYDPLLAERRAAVTTYLRGNHAVRLEDWRWIRYADGGEELYHTSEDPDERENLAEDRGYAPMMKEMASFLPKHDAPEVEVKSKFEFIPESYTWRKR